MSVLIYLVPVSLVLLGFAVWAFWWAVKRGQFDDLDTPAIDILAEDDKDAAVRETAALKKGGAPSQSQQTGEPGERGE